MRTPAVASLFVMTGIVGAALVCFVMTDSSARTAEVELLTFKKRAWAEAQKRQIYPMFPTGYNIASMVPPTISPSDQERIDGLQLRHESLIHRRAKADWIFTRGMAVAILIAGVCWFPVTPKSKHLPVPTAAGRRC